MRARAAHHRNQRNARLTLAWHIEAFARIKQLPKLSELIERDEEAPRKAQTWEEQYAIAMQWHHVLTAQAKQQGR